MNILSKYKNLKTEHNFLKALTGAALSRFGDGIDTIAFSILIYRVTGSTMLVATLFAVNGLPNLIFSIISGAVSTYKDEKKIMAICDWGRGLCVSMIVVLCLLEQIQVWHLYVITFLNSSFESFRAPASAGILPKILKEELKEEGLALEAALTKLTEIFGLAISTAIISQSSLEIALMIDAITFLICGILVSSIKIGKKEYQKLEIKQGIKDIREGFFYVRKHKKVLDICVFTCIINVVFIPINVYQVPYIEDILHGQDYMLSVMGISMAAAMCGGAFFMPKIKQTIGEKTSFLCGGFAIGTAYGILTYIKNVGTAGQYLGLAAGMGLLGFGIAVSNFVIQIRFFREIEQDYLARVSAISSMFALCVVPVFSALSGIILNFVSMPTLFIMSGGFAIIVYLVQFIGEKASMRVKGENTMELTMLGTGNALVTKCYNTCFAIKEKDQYFIIDGGGGNTILRQLEEAGIDQLQIKDIFVTHKHVDHVMGVIWMMRVICQAMKKGKQKEEVRIYAHDELIPIIRQMADMLLQKSQTEYIGKQLHLIPVNDGETVTIMGHSVTFFDIHSTKAKQYGFSMELTGGEKLTCLGDEPYNEAEEVYVKNSKWLLHEAFCLYSQADIFEPYEKHHSTVKEACELAERMNVQNLILYHTEDKNIEHRKEWYTKEGKEYFSGNLYVPDDLESFQI